MTDQTMSENGVENAQMTEGTQVKTTRFGMLVEKIRFGLRILPKTDWIICGQECTML